MASSKGWLVHKGVYSDRSCKWNMVTRQRDALLRAGLDFDFIDVVEASARLVRIFSGESELLPGWVLFRNPDMDMRRALETLGVTCVNSYMTASICRDKFLTAAFCEQNGIPHPVTMKVPAMEMSQEQRTRFMDDVESVLGYPVIVKGAYGSGGLGVVMAKDREELDAALPHENRNRIVQQFVDTSWGRDARLFVIDGRAVFAHERVNTDGDFRSNEAQGGHFGMHEITDDERTLAERIGVLLPRSTISVDVIWDGEGKPIVCEMNGNPDFSDLDDPEMADSVFEDSIAKMICDIAKEGR